MTISNNQADDAGGGLRVSNASNPADVIEIETSDIEKNGAADGGGISVKGSDLTLVGVAIVGNDADDEGGGIQAAVGSTVTATGMDISQNTATQGGGVRLSEADFSCTGTTATNGIGLYQNTASSAGAGVYVGTDSQFVAVDCDMGALSTDNKVGGTGSDVTIEGETTHLGFGADTDKTCTYGYGGTCL